MAKASPGYSLIHVILQYITYDMYISHGIFYVIYYHFCKTMRVVAVAEAGAGYLKHINIQYIIYDIHIF